MGLRQLEETGEEEVTEDSNKTEYVQKYQAFMDVADRQKQVRLALPRLQRFQPHADDPSALVSRFRAQRITNLGPIDKNPADCALWEVEVTWSTQEDSSKNPLTQPPKIVCESEEHNRVRIKDRDGKLYANTAGDLMDDPPHEEEESDLVFRFTKNIPAATLPKELLTYPNASNSDAVRIKNLICEPKTLKAKKFAVGEDEFAAGVDFCKLSFELHYRQDTWAVIVPSKGFYELVALKQTGSSNIASIGGQQFDTNPDDIFVGTIKGVRYYRRRILVGPKREPPEESVFLDKTGRAIQFPTEKNVVFLTFFFKDLLPFSQLPIK